MKITFENVEVAEKASDLAMKVVLFLFVLVGVVVVTCAFIYCEMHDKDSAAKWIFGYGDALFFSAFGTLMYYFFWRPGQPKTRRALPDFVSKDDLLQ